VWDQWLVEGTKLGKRPLVRVLAMDERLVTTTQEKSEKMRVWGKWFAKRTVEKFSRVRATESLRVI